MIIVKTGLRKLPDKCTKCKYSFIDHEYLNYESWRYCRLMPDSHGHQPIPKTFVKSLNNWVYIRPVWCPLREV